MMKNKLADAADVTVLSIAIIAAAAAAIMIVGLIAVSMFISLDRYTADQPDVASEQTDEGP